RRGQNSPMDTLLKRPTREPRPPARRAYAPEGTEKKPIVFRSRGVMQRSPQYTHIPVFLFLTIPLKSLSFF
ncbi:MAG: hypothetical protein R6T98_12860, partial [Desulfatiglandales bacterium]